MRRAYGALLILWGLSLVLGCSVEGQAASLYVPGIISYPQYFSADGQELYFWSNFAGTTNFVGPSHLYGVPRAGGEPSRRDERIPSPDGRVTAVVSDQAVWLVDASGNYRDLGIKSPRAPAWSPDSSQLLVLSCESVFIKAGCAVLLVDPVSGEVKNTSAAAGGAYLARWSPNGRWLAIYGFAGIVLYNVPAGEVRAEVPNVESVDKIVWSPNSSRIAFDTYVGDTYRMYVLSTSGAKARMPDALWPVAWSPDNKRLAYYSNGLFSVDIDGTHVRKLFPAHEQVVLSNDWRWVAFSDQSFYGLDIYVQQLGHAPRRITPSQCTAAPAPCLQGTDHRDRFAGGPTRDVYLAGAGDDDVLGGGGNDRLEGGLGKDRLVGGTGKNVVYGGWGDDVLSGGPEADSLYGGQGHDRIYGGGGNDFIFVRDNDRDGVDCGPGADRVIADPQDVVRNCERVDRRR